MISVGFEEVSSLFGSVVSASDEFDRRVAKAPASVGGGAANFALYDMLATFAHVTLVAVQHVDASVEFGKQAVADLGSYEQQASNVFGVLRRGIG